MAVFRVQKTLNYTNMSNHHLRNKNLSLKAKGFLSLMLSLPEDWDLSLIHIYNLSGTPLSSPTAAGIPITCPFCRKTGW